MAFKEELKLHFDARIALINVVTSEEARVLQELTEMANASDWPQGEGLYTWDVDEQFQCLKPAKDSFDTTLEATPDTILRRIEDFAGGATFVLKDFHQVWEARRDVVRGIRNLAARLPESAPRKNVVITTPERCLPVELKHDVPVLEAPPLARALYRHADLGDEIPAALYTAVAEVLAYVYQLRRNHQHGGPVPQPPELLSVPASLDPGVPAP